MKEGKTNKVDPPKGVVKVLFKGYPRGGTMYEEELFEKLSEALDLLGRENLPDSPSTEEVVMQTLVEMIQDKGMDYIRKNRLPLQNQLKMMQHTM